MAAPAFKQGVDLIKINNYEERYKTNQHSCYMLNTVREISTEYVELVQSVTKMVTWCYKNDKRCYISITGLKDF